MMYIALINLTVLGFRRRIARVVGQRKLLGISALPTAHDPEKSAESDVIIEAILIEDFRHGGG